MRPTSATTLSNPILGAVAYEHALDASERGFIADMVMPVFETPVSSAEYPVIPNEALLKLPANGGARAPRAGYGRSDFNFEKGTFSCKEYGWEEVVDDGEANLYASYFDAEQVATRRAVDILLRLREARVAAALFSETTLTATAITAAWNDPAGNPRADCQTGIAAVRNASGVRPNTFICGFTVFQAILNNKTFLDHIKYTDPVLARDMDYQKRLVAMYLGVDEVLVGDAVKDSKKKGAAFTATDIWSSTYALLALVAKNPRDLSEPCIGRSFLNIGDTPNVLTTETYREESKRSGIVRVRHSIDEAFVFTGCAYLMKSMIAS